ISLSEGGRLHPVRDVRGQAEGVREEPAARRGGARQGVAHGPLLAPARGAARSRGQGADSDPLRDGRRRGARRGNRGDRIGRSVRAGRCQRVAAPLAALRAPDLRGGAAYRRAHLHLHERPAHVRGAVMAEPRSLTPAEIVAELDRYIVGQDAAKRAVAIALRNRWRRFRVAPELRDEVMPKNIILVGPTGVGKTEIARRLARLAHAPFVKVEASKFTEVGYVGRDVDSMIRDLMEQGVQLVREEQQRAVQGRAQEMAEERLLDLLLPANAQQGTAGFSNDRGGTRE